MPDDLSIDDLRELKSLAIVVKNQAYVEFQAMAGGDFLRHHHTGEPPEFSSATRSAQRRVDELNGCIRRVGVAIDARLVAEDPDCEKYPAAHARQRDRLASAAHQPKEGTP